MAERALTPQQLLFVDFYLQTSNATQSAIKAGYSEATAAEQGCRLLTLERIKTYLKEKQASIAESLGIDPFYVLRRVKKVIDDSSERDEYFQPNAALKGLDMLGKHIGVFKEEDKNVNVNIDIRQMLLEVHEPGSK